MPSLIFKIKSKWNKILDSLKSKQVTNCSAFAFDNIPCNKSTKKPYIYCDYHYRLKHLEWEAYHFTDDRQLDPELRAIISLTKYEQRLHFENKFNLSRDWGHNFWLEGLKKNFIDEYIINYNNYIIDIPDLEESSNQDIEEQDNNIPEESPNWDVEEVFDNNKIEETSDWDLETIYMSFEANSFQYMDNYSLNSYHDLSQ